MLIAVIVGLAISVMQAVTQLQDQTLSFVPKIIAMALAACSSSRGCSIRWSITRPHVFTNVPSLL